MQTLRLEELARWCGAEYKGDAVITGVGFDSRKTAPGDLFIALTGEKADGHAYIGAAAEKGAAAAVASRAVDAAIPLLLVPDPEKALCDIAAAYRQSLPVKVVAITGSVGKTTTKEMSHLVLARKYKTGKSEGNHNNQLGLPLSLFSLDDTHELAVLELGMNHFGEMSRLTAIARPDTAVIVNIGTMHIEHLGSREGILKAKLEILEGLKPGGLAVFNGDEPLLWNLRGKLNTAVRWFGIENPACDVRAEHIRMEDGLSVFDAVCGEERTEIRLPVEGRHNIMNALAALTVGAAWGVPWPDMARALNGFENTGMRQKIYKAAGFTIIEDCYNAGPESTAAALEVLAARPGRKIAVLGSMLELGGHASAEHEKIGRLAAEKADILLTYGADMGLGAAAAKSEGMAAEAFTDREALVDALISAVRPGDTILFKGSRGMAMEKALALFLQKAQEGKQA